MTTSFKERLKKRDLLVGSLLSIGSSDVADILSRVGFDYLWLEMEHAPTSAAQVQQMIQAVGGRCPCIVRAPWNDHVWIKHILDTGCDGIVIPQIRSAAEAKAAIDACKYPPIGTRSVGVGRAQGYGMEMQDYVQHANERLVTILQIEHIDAVKALDSILDVPGFDAILIGPYDLSASMGLIEQVTHADVQNAIATIKKACAARNIPIGIFAPDAAFAKAHIADGCTLIAMGIDAIYLWKATKQALSEVRS
jgi:2-dehydro-3-deoxyglucarate aldolase/4-hydroxy-2-oxoheptanedioate aldolase